MSGLDQRVKQSNKRAFHRGAGMLELRVYRHDGTLVDPENSSFILFYDERIRVDLQASRPCEMHLYMTIVGSMPDREREHSVVIYDENLPRDQRWSEDIHIRHPRSPLQNPHLEVVVTARYPTEEEQAAEPDATTPFPSEKYLTPLRPIQSTRAGFLVPFGPPKTSTESPETQLASLTASGRGGHARAISTISISFDNAEAYEELETKEQNRSELVSSRGVSEEPKNNHQTSPEEDGGLEVFRWKAPVTQALELEIRSLRPALEKDRVIAEIDLVSGPFFTQINLFDVSLDGGLADLMGTEPKSVVLKPFEKYALCYNLQLRSSSHPVSVSASRKPLIIALECEVLLSDDVPSVSFRPNIRTEWMPIVDFEGTQGPLPKTPALNMNINSPMPAATSSNSGSQESALNPLSLVGSSRPQSSSSLSLMGGITIMISGPQFVRVGDEFEWAIKVMNRSQRNRIFTMSFGNLTRDLYRQESHHGGDRMALLSNYNADYLRRRSQNQYRSTAIGRGIIPLCQELKVGNLAPHVCFETRIRLKALTVGTHTIEEAKIEDSASRDSYDVGGLLEVIVES